MEKAVEALGDAWDKNEAGVKQTITTDSELYTVRNAVWEAAGMEPWGGCLCIRCIEKRLGRRLRPKDFIREHEFNSLHLPGTELRAARLSAGRRRG